MTPRASWKRLAEPPRYCSKACRRQRPGRLDRALETAILDLLAQRDPGKTICPSEAARAVFGDDDDRWRDAMERTRRAARRLVAQGRLRILQGGRVVDPSTAKGPIRLGRPRR